MTHLHVAQIEPGSVKIEDGAVTGILRLSDNSRLWFSVSSVDLELWDKTGPIDPVDSLMSSLFELFTSDDAEALVNAHVWNFRLDDEEPMSSPLSVAVRRIIRTTVSKWAETVL